MLSTEPNTNSLRCLYKPPKGGGIKRQISNLFSNKTAFFSKKVCYKFSLYENFQRHAVRRSLAYLTV